MTRLGRALGLPREEVGGLHESFRGLLDVLRQITRRVTVAANDLRHVGGRRSDLGGKGFLGEFGSFEE